jgi:perosamine synthetase
MTVKRVGGNEEKYVLEVLATEFRSSKGSQMTSQLEKKFAEKFESEFAIAFVNGTATMHALLEARGVGPGDEVIVPPLTMSATTFAVLQCNATPVFADVDPETFQISAESIGQRITPKTKAIITVALYGLSPDMDPIMALANKHGIFVIEDNAECFLAKYKGRMVGTLGHAASYSFQFPELETYHERRGRHGRHQRCRARRSHPQGTVAGLCRRRRTQGQDHQGRHPGPDL